MSGGSKFRLLTALLNIMHIVSTAFLSDWSGFDEKYASGWEAVHQAPRDWLLRIKAEII